MKLFGLTLMLCLLCGCATNLANTNVGAGRSTEQGAIPVVQNQAVANQGKPTEKVTPPVASPNPSFDARIGSALTSPLSDFNLVRTEIPEILLFAKKAPYALPKEADCTWLAAEVLALNSNLGPDVDAVKLDEQGNVMDKGSEELGNATVNALRSFTEGFVPFRSWIRRLTGADSHAKEVASAGIAGVIRRGFLKGVMAAKSCGIEDLPNSSPPSKEPSKEIAPAPAPVK